MSVLIINPKNQKILSKVNNNLVDDDGNTFQINKGVPRIAKSENYTENFGKQWNLFDKTQLDNDSEGSEESKRRFFAETNWENKDLSGQNILEVGSGAGRFSQVILNHTQANLFSVDYSDAVSANYKNHHKIAPERFELFQASIYELPFPDNSFDKVLCLGVLQHTPDFRASVKALIDKAKPGAEIIVDFYEIKGWWTKIHAKYMFRTFTKKMAHEKLLRLIENNVDWLIKLNLAMYRIGLGIITRFLPVCDVKDILSTSPKSIDKDELRERVILDTFDQYSPQHDHPQRLKTVEAMFQGNNSTVTFSGRVEIGSNSEKKVYATVVRAVKRYNSSIKALRR